MFLIVIIVVAVTLSITLESTHRICGCTQPTGYVDYYCWEMVRWAEIEVDNLDSLWEGLGWTESRWNRNDERGTASDKYWFELNEAEKTSASSLGFTENNWIDGGICLN